MLRSSKGGALHQVAVFGGEESLEEGDEGCGLGVRASGVREHGAARGQVELLPGEEDLLRVLLVDLRRRGLAVLGELEAAELAVDGGRLRRVDLNLPRSRRPRRASGRRRPRRRRTGPAPSARSSTTRTPSSSAARCAAAPAPARRRRASHVNVRVFGGESGLQIREFG